MQFAVVVTLLACAFAASSTDHHQDGLGRMLGGQEAARGEWPQALSLQFKSGGIVFSHVCNAVCISPSWSLTAAQCKDSFDLSRYRVQAGLIIHGVNTSDVQTRKIDEFILHPDYHGGRDTNDIALIRVVKPFTKTEAVLPAKLPASGSDPSGDAVLCSWGSGKTLQWGRFPLLSYDDCAAALNDVGPFDRTQTCTGSPSVGKSACNDDLGGCLLQDATVIGIASWGVDPCGTGVPHAYTRVDSHLEFIHEHVDDLAA